MSRSIRFYYGLSGTFKTTTIKTKLGTGDDVLWSGIKRWKIWEKDVLMGKNNPSDLNFALLHLSRLSDLEFNIAKDDSTLFIERGVSDMLFYWLRNNPACKEETIITNLIEEELRVSKKSAGGDREPEKILLVQRDYDFVRDVVFKEPSRSKCFPGGIEEYIDTQNQYIDFTKKYNKITSIVEINNAKEYLRSLGVNWETQEISSNKINF